MKLIDIRQHVKGQSLKYVDVYSARCT